MLDILRDFQSENELEGTDFDVPVSHSENQMTIAELLASSIVMEWFEAVAISQAICETLRLSGDGSGPVRISPDLVSIDGSGAVHVAAKRTKDGRSALEEVAGLLKTMLADRDVPTPLRLALSQTATNNSVEEWANTIAYYERPNRAAVIQALYERAKNRHAEGPVAVRAIPVAPAEPAPLASIPQPRKAKMNADVAKQVKRYAPAIGVAVVVSAVIAVTIWAIQTRRPSSPTNSAVASPSAENSAVENAPVENAPAALSSATAVFETLVSRLPVIGRRESSVELAPLLPPSGRWFLVPSRRSPPVYQRTEPAVTRSLPLPIPSVSEGERGSPSLQTRTVSVNNTIYSAADSDVVPPVAVYPQFPTIPSGTNAENVAQFDVLVMANGEVESVRARGVSESLSDTMIMTMSLSAAKTWRFRPGLRNGEPVKYMHVISILKNR